MSQRALLLLNRHSRRGRDTVSEAVTQLEGLGFELLEESTEKPTQLPEIIRQYRERVDLVIIGGGDGTLNAAAEGLVDTQLPLGILPLGTANDLARTLSIPQELPEACNIIANGDLRRIDLGCVNNKHFFNVASLGLSVEITRQLNGEIKRRWGVLAYAVTALKVVGQTRPFAAEIRINGTSIPVRTVQIAVGNGRFYGGGLVVAEDATINDQQLDLYSLEIQHWGQIIALLPAMLRGSQGNWAVVRTLAGQEIEIHTRKRRAINADGELVTHTPAHFRLVPQAVSVFVPKVPVVPGLQTSE
jgi:YegS/Rv2252/BmrU family lipid kinase